ncbi:centromere-associated protein E [Selaginella moellendorffii]|uniref:centromere-associated protein E n=1 Tax=Selaginella moellendorffii TaxID=88036 RepID=UPI000D1C9FE1|nr:centromere-associated protein E [Selaginella moellendorffii]|eukprot:XP_024542100.1 centromere-associated protein E [Selaginella moellendorffii]
MTLAFDEECNHFTCFGESQASGSLQKNLSTQFMSIFDDLCKVAEKMACYGGDGLLAKWLASGAMSSSGSGNYIAPGENRPCVPIFYVECTLSAWPLPAGDWKKSLDGAFGFAVDAAAKRFNLRKEDLEAKISDPSYKNSRLTPEAWARQNYIRVVPKPDQGLEGENTRLKDLNSKLILQVTNQKEEIKNTKDKLMKVNKEQAEKIQELQKDSREIVSLKEENTKLTERVAELEEKLKEETLKRKEETSKLKEELTDLSRQLSAQGRELSALQQRLSALRMFERVLLRKLCKAAREKCVRLAREADVEIPLAADGKINWNEFFNIPG